MTKRATITQAQMCRMIKAARREGLRVAGIKPDGTLILDDHSNPQPDDKRIEQDHEVVL
jgi:hypothetical protein